MSPLVLLIALHLATPLAQGPFVLECTPNLGYDGIAYSSESPPRVELAARHCRRITRIVLRPWSVGVPWTSEHPLYSLQVLLHEARHIGQSREGFEPDAMRELDAECRSVRDLGRAATLLGVRRAPIRRAVRDMLYGIRHSPPPYGGECE